MKGAIKTITINSIDYNVVQATAPMQKRLMLIMGGKIAFNASKADVETINTAMLVGALMTMPEQQFDEVAKIVLHKTIQSGESELVSVDDFQGSIVSYFKLVAEAIAFNLDDYFTLLDEERADRRRATKPASQ